MEMIGPEINIIMGTVFSVLLSIIAYFLKQLHTDFKKVACELQNVQNTVIVNKTQIDGVQELLHQKIDFIERRLSIFEDSKR